jgi:hypothetical protein
MALPCAVATVLLDALVVVFIWRWIRESGDDMSRALWISLIVGIALAGGLSACATQHEPAAVTAAAQAQCYWLSDEGAGWVARPDLADAELCFEMDSCSGGLGMSGGGCYKWAASEEAPAAPWTDLGMLPRPRGEE